MLPDYVSELFKATAECQPYNLRNNDLLGPPVHRSATAQNSLEYRAAIDFNQLIIKNIVNDNLEVFKKMLKMHIINNVDQ